MLTVESNYQGDYEIYSVDFVTGELLNLTNNAYAQDYEPTWSPDGRFLAFVSESQGSSDLYLLNVTTGSTTNLSQSASTVHNYYPAWSPDSRYLAFEDNFKIVVMDTESQMLRHYDQTNLYWLTWSANSEFIVFTSTGTGMNPGLSTWNVNVLSPKNGNVHKLVNFQTDNADYFNAPFAPVRLVWLSDIAEILIFRKYPGGPEYAIESFDLETGEVRRLIDRVTMLNMLQLSPDEDKLMFSDSKDILVLNPENGVITKFTENFHEQVFLSAISPEWTEIAFNTYETPNRLYFMGIDDKEPYHFLDLPVFRNFAWWPQCP